TVIDLETEEEGAVAVPGHRIFSWPSWAGPGMLVSALAPKEKYEGDSIALLDVRNPAKATIIDVLWERGEGPDVSPRWPVYCPDTRECFFVGEEPTKRMIYMVKRGEPLRASPLDVIERTRPGQYQQLGGLSFSPDGRYLLF